MSFLRRLTIHSDYPLKVRAILEAADRDMEYTPDSWRLDRYEFLRLFVPDEMMRGFYRYPLIQDTSYFAYRAFTEESMTLWKKKLGAATYAIPLPQAYPNVPLAHIGGQVHIIQHPSLLFKELDKLKLNGVQFIRRRASVIIPFRETSKGRSAGHERVRRKYCYMYVGLPEYWNEQLDGGYFFAPCRRIEESKMKHVKDYYLFSKLEYSQ